MFFLVYSIFRFVFELVRQILIFLLVVLSGYFQKNFWNEFWI